MIISEKTFNLLSIEMNSMTYVSNTKRKTVGLALAFDAILVTMACLIPAASHLFALPLYKFNPMLLLLLAGMVVSRDWRNGLFLALLMPLISSLLIGMPTGGKMVCMMAELATVATLFPLIAGIRFHKRYLTVGRVPAGVALLVAFVAAKGVYYALKALILAPAALVGTEWWMQLAAMVLWGGLFLMVYRRQAR